MATELLTQTMRHSFKWCRRYFWLKHENQLARRDKKPGRRKGAAFAAALDRLNDPLPSFSASAQAKAVIIEQYLDVHPNSQQEADEIEIEQQVIRILAVDYINFYGPTERREVEYNLPLVNPDSKAKRERDRRHRTFRRAGKIDGVVKIGPRHVEIIEDKLMGQIQRPMVERLPLDEQTTEYVDAFAELGWRADVRYRLTRWPSIKRRKSETVDEYIDRFQKDVRERQEFYFIEIPITFPKGHLEEFRRERWQMANDIVQARSQGRWYKNPTRCWEWGGCEFIPICCQWEGASDLYVTETKNPELEEQNDEDEG